MSALVIYESMFGNTKRVALAIADGISTKLPVQTLEVGDAPEEIPPGVDLLVVGGPTHVHGMSSPRTRASAAERTSGAIVSERIGIREWLDRARVGTFEVPAAAFDTRINGRELFTGSAAKGYVRGLRSAGFRVDQPPHSFLVAAKAPPESDALLPGELDEAWTWGQALAARVASRT
jgi:hypothetical protein